MRSWEIPVSSNTVAHSLHLQKQPAQPPPAGAALEEHLIWSLILCGTCPTHDSSTVRVFSISQFLCFAQFLLLGVFAVLSEEKKIHITVTVHSGGEDLTISKNSSGTMLTVEGREQEGEPYLMGSIVSINRLVGEMGKKWEL